MILNLQEPGEHPHCGDKIHKKSGFSYYPEEFQSQQIDFYNFGWPDFTATGLKLILRIIKIMEFAILQ